MKKLTITGVIVVGITMITGAALADRKNYPGSACMPEHPSAASYRLDAGRATVTGGGWTGFTCPIVQEDSTVCPNDMDVHGYDGNGAAGSSYDFVCNFQSFNTLTGSLLTSSTKTSSGGGVIDWDWGAMSCYGGQESSLHLFCGIPGPESGSGDLSYIFGYSVDE